MAFQVLKRPLVPVAIAALAASIYARDLDRVPAFLTLDEAHFSVHAHALAHTGRNLNGQLLPALISLADPEGEPYDLPWGETYYLPFGIYLIAGALQVLPFAEATVRLPSALLGGVLNVVLLYWVAMVWFRDRKAAAAASLLLVLAPGNMIISRQALDSVCQIPFILGSLICLGRFVHTRQARLAFTAGAVLGAGVYSYITSVVVMPVVLAMFWLITWRAGVLTRRAWLLSIGGFVVALLPLALWLLWHPDVVASLLMQYNRADPGSSTLMDTMRRGGSAAAVREFTRIYWSYFDPSFLFVQGGNARNLSTGEAGVFLMPVAVLAPLGVAALRSRPHALLLFVMLVAAAPLPAVIKGAPYAIQRVSSLLSLISLLAGIGFSALWSSQRNSARLFAVVLAMLTVWQFTTFHRDYHGNYRVRSAHAYDSTAFTTGAEAVLEEDRRSPVARVYMPVNFFDAGAKWRFHTTKHARADLWRRTSYYSGVDELSAAPAGAVAVVPGSVAAVNGWAQISRVRNLMGEPTLTILRRQ